MAKRYTPLDALTKFCEDLTVTASGVVQKNSADVVLKIGAGRQEFAFVVDVELLDTASGNEKYEFVLQGCNLDTFSGSDIENLAIIAMGHTSVRLGGAKTSVPGRYVADVANDLLAEYTYVRLNVIVSGTTPSIKFTAFLSER
jgi:hypothetical protein